MSFSSPCFQFLLSWYLFACSWPFTPLCPPLISPLFFLFFIIVSFLTLRLGPHFSYFSPSPIHCPAYPLSLVSLTHHNSFLHPHSSHYYSFTSFSFVFHPMLSLYFSFPSNSHFIPYPFKSHRFHYFYSPSLLLSPMPFPLILTASSTASPLIISDILSLFEAYPVHSAHFNLENKSLLPFK